MNTGVATRNVHIFMYVRMYFVALSLRSAAFGHNVDQWRLITAVDAAIRM